MRRKLSKLFLVAPIVALLLLGLTVPASASISPETLNVTLAPGQSVAETKVVDIPEMPPKADVLFSFDLTGSMGGIIDTAKAKAGKIMDALDGTGVDINYGVASYMDYPGTYTSYGYSATYGSAASGDYAYSLDQAITNDRDAVEAAINGLSIGWGADGPEDYTRVMYESYADPAIDWRPGAKKMLVNFGDNVPHDNDLNEDVPGKTGTWSTGGDPGPDEVILNADDLDLQTVLAAMDANGVTLLECHSSTYANEYWTYWAGITGGGVYITSSSTLVDDVVAAITSELSSPTIEDLTLVASSGYESWLVSVDPASYSGPTGVSVTFDIEITVPDGTAPGVYEFIISAVDGDGVNYGDQSVTITVVEGFVTGGGWIEAKGLDDGKSKGKPERGAFGLEARYEDGETSGNVQYNAAGLRFHSESVDSLRFWHDGGPGPDVPDAGYNHALIAGTGRLNGESGYTFEVLVEDRAEPGKDFDAFGIKIYDADGDLFYEAGNTLGGGNIQIH